MITIQKGHDKLKHTIQNGKLISETLNCFAVDISFSYEKVNNLNELIFRLFNCIYSNK